MAAIGTVRTIRGTRFALIEGSYYELYSPEWTIYHLCRLGIESGNHDILMMTRREVRRRKHSNFGKALSELLKRAPKDMQGSVLREE